MAARRVPFEGRGRMYTSWRVRKAAWCSGAALLAVALSGCPVDGPPETFGQAQVSASSLVFPDTRLGQSANRELTIENVGQDGSVTIESASLTGPDAAVFRHGFDGSVGPLAPGESLTVPLTFSPTAAGARTATLQMTQAEGPELSVALSATALPPAPTSRLVVGAPELNASTYVLGSFRFTNDSPAGQQVASLRINLSSSVLPDLVFDPEGKAGDTTSRPFTVSGSPGVGTIGHSFSGPHDLGWDVLTATFTDFVPGKTVAFAVDVDPSTIKGTRPPGPNESGSVSGLELAGATITVAYEDGTTQEGRLFRTPNSLGQSEVRLNGTSLPQPTLEVVDVPQVPANVSNAAQTIRVTAPANSTVRLLRAEGGLYLDGLPGGGFDVDPFETNTLVAVAEQQVTIGPEGSTDVAVTLTKADPRAGSNRFLAVVTDTGGVTGPTSNLVVLQLQ